MPTGVTLDKTTLSVKVGEGYNLKPTVLPENADNKTLTYTSADDTIATVDSSGRIVGVKEGTVKITAKTVNNLTAECTVTVTAAAAKAAAVRSRKKKAESAE